MEKFDQLFKSAEKVYIHGVFLTGTPPKTSKFKKVNLG